MHCVDTNALAARDTTTVVADAATAIATYAAAAAARKVEPIETAPVASTATDVAAVAVAIAPAVAAGMQRTVHWRLRDEYRSPVLAAIRHTTS